MSRLMRPLWVILGLLLAMTGCKGKVAESQAMPAPLVTTMAPVEKMVVQYEEFRGRTEATESVEVRAKVSGYLKKIHFTPGAELKEGDLLFDIDPEPFKADLAKAEADELAAKARLQQLTAEVARLERGRATGAVTPDEFEKAVGGKAEADATLKGSKARVETAKLNLGYAQIKSPLNGRIGDKLVSEGNLIAGGQGTTTLLTTIVSVDPMDVAYDIDENTLQRIQLALREGRLKLAKPGEVPVEMGLAIHGNQYPLKGVLKFINNTIDAKTGSIRLKAQFLNPKGENSEVRQLTPGMAARVRLPMGEPAKKWLIPDSAIGSDQGNKFLFVVVEGKAVRLDATLGAQADGMRVIESVQGIGDKTPRPLGAGDAVIINGLQRVRPGAPVEIIAPAKK